MKKTISLIFIFILIGLVAACSPKKNSNDEKILNEAYEALALNFEAGDSLSHVSLDFRLPLYVETHPDVGLIWSSSNDQIIKQVGLFARVNAPQVDTEVTLTATLSLLKSKKDKDFKLNVIGYTDYEFTGYYESLSGLVLDEFTVELKSMIENRGTQTGTTAQVKSIDLYEGQNYNIYTGYGAYGNREHVWPQSHLGSAPKDDLHNLRASEMIVNSTRGNRFFTDYVDGGSWRTVGTGFYPGEEHIGDIARIILYIYLRYDLNIQLVGNIELFVMWHQMDPVSAFELSRNDKIFGIQQNRNPFIDYPDLVELMFPIN